MSDEQEMPTPKPRPQGDLVVVGATPGYYWHRQAEKVQATVIVRDAAGLEWQFDVTCPVERLNPYYR